jgi:DNA polymerase epsilon subunit 1
MKWRVISFPTQCALIFFTLRMCILLFFLGNVIPLSSDDVLWKIAGTLCEMLLMFQAREKRIVAPNKPDGSAFGKLSRDGHILEFETYVGGHVESLRTGIYRSDLPVRFEINPMALDDLESSLDETLKFASTEESKRSLDEIVSFDELRQEIMAVK